jgi:quercetin dioxygenase-like cupin family protein
MIMTFVSLKDIEEKEIIPGYKARFVHSENMTFASWDIEKDAVLPEHSHLHEQVANVLDGRFEIVINGEKKVLERGGCYRAF